MEQDCRFAKIFLDTSINFNVEILRVLDVFCAKKLSTSRAWMMSI